MGLPGEIKVKKLRIKKNELFLFSALKLVH